MTGFRFLLCVCLSLCASAVNPALSNPPTVSYIFPAGAQRGTTVDVRVGGLFLHDKPAFEIVGPGVTHSPHLTPTKRIWFEGPLLPLPESQQQEDYPADMTARVTTADNAPSGPRRVRVFTSQGGAAGPLFVVGDLPEVVENEIDGAAVPKPIQLPVTANGRIFPREDIDLWEFDGEPGKTVTAFVNAKSINSPLVPKLDILDTKGNVVAEPMPYPCVGTDGSVKFTPKLAGKYRVRITDANALGGPAYVYRLTVTTAEVPEFHFPIRAEADGLKDVTDPERVHAAPVALNGRIERPGGATEWRIELKKGHPHVFGLQARRYGSPLCGVVTVADATGKELARSTGDESVDPMPLAFTAPVDGAYVVRVTEKYRSRGGANFVYRLCVADAPEAGEPGFRLRLTDDVFSVERGGRVRVLFTAERSGGFAGPITLRATHLPHGVECKESTIPANQKGGFLELVAGPDAPIGHGSFELVGIGTVGDKPVSVVPTFRGDPGVRLAVALRTPFKIIDEYVMTAAPRGETYFRKYKIDRGGFDGPIRVQLADKQARHLQGVTGPVITLKPGQTEFEYPARLPPWMELGRTCRVCVMASATVTDPVDGREHTVSFSSTEQNQQMIVVVGPGRLDLSAEKTSIRAEGTVKLAVKVSRSKSLTGPATVELVLPEHVKGVRAANLVVAADKSEGEFVLTFTPDAGPFNVPLVLRATVATEKGPVTAETKVEGVK